jgi:hypothetical protein
MTCSAPNAMQGGNAVTVRRMSAAVSPLLAPASRLWSRFRPKANLTATARGVPEKAPSSESTGADGRVMSVSVISAGWDFGVVARRLDFSLRTLSKRDFAT